MKLPRIFVLVCEATVVVFAAIFIGACASASSSTSAPAGDSDDQVRIGYGTQERTELTGSVGSVTAEDTGREVTSLADMISGRFAGVYVQHLPNGGISVRIRGASSLLGDGEPLYVIDGLPIQGPAGSALLGVNPRDVARIDILKDAGATAIYGSRGANGVVLITRKQAQ
jgi:TonB-dependent SusC/RagA subfamily outer membrane receptor